MDGGGNPLPPTFMNFGRSVTRPIRGTISKIGQSVADDLTSAYVKTPSVTRPTRSLSKNTQVYTPEGVFKGSDVFMKRPDLTERQIEGILRGQVTKLSNQHAKLAHAGRLGATYGGIAGVAGTIGVQQSINVVKELTSSVTKKMRRSGGGKSPKR